MRRIVITVTIIFLLSALVGALGVEADSSDSTSITGNNGFGGGGWDRFGLSHPRSHKRGACEPAKSGRYTARQPCHYGPGDWALDYYGPAGTSVRYSAAPTNTKLTAKVWAVQPTCAAGASAGGWTVFVDVFAGSSWEGWIAYAHLDGVTLQPGASVSPGAILGKLKKWPFKEGCWEVKSDQGVHTHIEMWDKYKFACYKGYASGTTLTYPKPLGIMGRTIYTSVQSQCK